MPAMMNWNITHCENEYYSHTKSAQATKIKKNE